MSREYFVWAPGAGYTTTAESPEHAVEQWAVWAQSQRFKNGPEHVQVEGVTYKVRLQVLIHVDKIKR